MFRTYFDEITFRAPLIVFSIVLTFHKILTCTTIDLQITELPRQLFYCHELKVLHLNDNELKSIPPAINSLINLTKLDLSRNGKDFCLLIKCIPLINSYNNYSSALHTKRQYERAEEPAPPGPQHEWIGEAS